MHGQQNIKISRGYSDNHSFSLKANLIHTECSWYNYSFTLSGKKTPIPKIRVTQLLENYALQSATNSSSRAQEKLTVPQPAKNISTCHRIRRFITVSTTDLQSLGWDRWSHFKVPSSQSSKTRMNITLPSTLCVTSGLFPSGFPPKTLHALFFSQDGPYFSPISILLIWYERYESWRFSLCNCLPSPVISSLSRPNIIPSTLFSNSAFMLETIPFFQNCFVTRNLSHKYLPIQNFLEVSYKNISLNLHSSMAIPHSVLRRLSVSL